MLQPKAQVSLSYKKEQIRYFFIACNNSNKNNDLKLQMIAKIIKETKTLQIIFKCFATLSPCIKIIHRHCGGFYIFIQDYIASLNMKVGENY